MFIKINKNSDGSHAIQNGGVMDEGWAFWDTEKVPLPASFPYVDIVTELVTHPAVVKTRLIDNKSETTIVIPEITRYEVISATSRDVPEEPKDIQPSQLDIIEAQSIYTAMMTDTLL